MRSSAFATASSTTSKMWCFCEHSANIANYCYDAANYCYKAVNYYYNAVNYCDNTDRDTNGGNDDNKR